MNDDHQINKLAEETMNSLDGIQRAEPQPFLYTRLSARMQRPANIWERSARYLSRPIVAVACLLLVFLVNGIVLLNNKAKQSEQNELLADDYTTSEMNTHSSVLFDMEQ